MWIVIAAFGIGAAAASAGTDNDRELDLRLHHVDSVALPVASRISVDRIARSVAAAAKPDALRDGIEASAEAVRECLREDERSGGLGPLSVPYGRPIAITDHCRRY